MFLCSALAALALQDDAVDRLFRTAGVGSDKEFDTWQRKKTGSYAWLYPRDAKKRVRIRFQPES